MTIFLPAILFAAGSFLAVVLAQFLARRLGTGQQVSDTAQTAPTFIIEGGEVIEANFNARQVLERRPGSDSLAAMKSWLAQRFDDVDTLASADSDIISTTSRDGAHVLHRARCARALRLTVEPVTPDTTVAALMEAETLDELETLRANISLSPFPLWRTNVAGEVIWLNEAYLDACRRRFGAEAVRRWPIPHLFEELTDPDAVRTGTPRRLSLIGGESGQVSWFDISMTEIGDDRLYTAMNVDDMVHAEGRLREVTQTLTKTFANLTIGLAVFGRQRNLTLFNPALTELTGLPPEFLISRPGLGVFLDRLREERMMPEPRDYKSWRDHLAQVEAEASDGTFEETWTLPGGQTWRVTGRPHPDGAIAILFEDISIEMSLTRRFHQELEQSQELLDMFDDAIAVFGIDGRISQTNSAYDRLWFEGQDALTQPDTVREATAHWHKLTSPTPIWGDFREFAADTRDRLEWSAETRLLDGRRLYCRFSPVSNGATLARFSFEAPRVAAMDQEMRQAV